MMVLRQGVCVPCGVVIPGCIACSSLNFSRVMVCWKCASGYYLN